MATAPHLEFERDIVEIQSQIEQLLDLADRKGIDVSDELTVLRSKLETLKEQTYDSLRSYLIEECFEVAEALDRQDPEALREELGDLLPVSRPRTAGGPP